MIYCDINYINKTDKFAVSGYQRILGYCTYISISE